jgi:SAM-dependent methyltransferase
VNATPACPVDVFVPHLIGLWRERFAAAAMSGGRRGALPPGRLTGPELYEAAAAVKELSRGFTRERGLPGSGYMDERDLLGGYLLFYWTVSFSQTWAALASAGLLGGDGPRARRVLDLGAGPGPSSLALLAAGAGSVVAVDRSAAALALAGDVARRSGRRLETRVADLAAGDPLPDGPFDLVTAVHAVNELWADRDDRIERRRALVEAAAARLGPGGRILLVDPALTATANEAIELRDALVASGWGVLAPCTRAGRCPALPDGTCHADVAWSPPPAVQRIGHAARIGRESLAFTYFLLEPPSKDASAASSAAASPSGDGPRYRVVSERFLAKSGRMRVLICGPEGRFPLSVDSHAAFSSAKTFRTLRRYDLIRVDGVEQRATGWGLAPASALRVDARAPTLATAREGGHLRPPRDGRRPPPRSRGR